MFTALFLRKHQDVNVWRSNRLERLRVRLKHRHPSLANCSRGAKRIRAVSCEHIHCGQLLVKLYLDVLLIQPTYNIYVGKKRGIRKREEVNSFFSCCWYLNFKVILITDYVKFFGVFQFNIRICFVWLWDIFIYHQVAPIQFHNLLNVILT